MEHRVDWQRVYSIQTEEHILYAMGIIQNNVNILKIHLIPHKK